MSRHPDVKSLRSVRYDWKRAKMSTTVNINEFFGRLKLPDLIGIPKRHTYNVDEIRTILGVSDAPVVLGAAELKEIFIADPLNREWVTIIKCICADGSVILPLIIFGGKNT